MMIGKKVIVIFISFIIILPSGCLRIPTEQKTSSQMQANSELHVEYPLQAEAQVIYEPEIDDIFRRISVDYSLVGNVSTSITHHHLRLKWDFMIVNRTQDSTIIYILTPNFGNLNITFEEQQVNLSRLSYYLLPDYNVKIFLLNLTYSKDKPLFGTLEYETTIDSLFLYYVAQFSKSFYYPENYPYAIYFSPNFVFPVSPAGIIGKVSRGNIVLVLPSRYAVISEYPLEVNSKNNQTIIIIDNSKPWGSVYIYKRGFFQETKLTIGDNNTWLVIYAPSNMRLYSKELTNATVKIIKHYIDRLMDPPYSEINVIFHPDLPFGNGEEFEDSGKGIAIVGIRDSKRIEDILPTLAHEVAHLWFGSYTNLTPGIEEGLATFMGSDAGYLSYSLGYTERQILKYSSQYRKPLIQAYKEVISNPQVRNAIKYYKGAFVFRSLQFVLGNETFFEGLRELLRECHGKECNLTDVQSVFEKVSGQDLDWFFKEWFYTAKVPNYYVRNLRLEKEDWRYTVSFEIIDKNNFTMPLEVEVKTPTKSFIKKIWVNGSARVEFELNEKPTEIILDPNEWMVNENKKYNVKGIEIIIE
ncbi:putative aminopeptidase [Pyrococcus sp. NA2]|uniref:M1 family aminopeptidase n=1 Tax=Pyrococcus sp. (strain NA2) TaxID=342949 RepID=UPI000209ABC6|nr:M1 family aminopeptidase [Pyrococcus sp. NA2]AEC51501.1 putative aminopeptidase [Pyrococcus sp. NA2]